MKIDYEIPKYTTGQIVKALNLPMQRLREWIQRRYFTPSLGSPGQGKKAYFSLADICRIELFRYLLEDKGVKREIARTLLKEITGIPSPLVISRYLVFKTVTEKGEKIPQFMFVAGAKELIINATVEQIKLSWPGQDRFTTPDLDYGDNEPQPDPPSDWEDLTVINIFKLRERVRIAVEAVA
jgi:hypothetical protein